MQWLWISLCVCIYHCVPGKPHSRVSAHVQNFKRSLYIAVSIQVYILGKLMQAEIMSYV